MTKLQDDYSEDVPRRAEEIARRALVLSAVITAVYGSPSEEVLDWMKNEGLKNEITSYELNFLNGRTPEGARIALSWKLEALVVLLWCIKKIDRLPSMAKQCDTELLKKGIVFPPAKTVKFISTSQLRDQHEIDAEYENAYQAHWTVRDAKINNKTIPDNLDPEVIYERHYAFNWVVGYMGQSWDEITTDT